MKTWPAQHWAAQRWLEMNGGEAKVEWPEDWTPNIVGAEIQNQCMERLAMISELMSDLDVTHTEIEKKWCEITMTPLLNRVVAERSAVFQ